jgi:flagellar protein FlaG
MEINRTGSLSSTPSIIDTSIPEVATRSVKTVAVKPLEIKDKVILGAELDNAVAKANSFLAITNNAIAFSIDKDSGRTVIKLIDTQTQHVIKQFPSSEMLAISKDMSRMAGHLISGKY